MMSSDNENSVEDIPHFTQPIFVLNRNGQSESKLREIFQHIAKEKFPDVEEIEVVWVSIFGKADKPHAFIVFNRAVVNDWCHEVGFVNYKEMNFELSGAVGCTAKEDEESCKLHYKNVPGKEENKEEIEETFRAFLFPVAEVKTVYFPKNWTKRGEIFVEFHDEQSASYALRLTVVCEFRTPCVNYPVILKGSYARIQKPRDSPSSTESPSPNPLKKSPNTRTKTPEIPSSKKYSSDSSK